MIKDWKGVIFYKQEQTWDIKLSLKWRPLGVVVYYTYILVYLPVGQPPAKIGSKPSPSGGCYQH